MGDITWTNTRRKLGDLQPWPRNPRMIKTDEAKRLAQSFQEFGQVEMIAIGPGDTVYNGHQRLNVLMDKHGPTYEVDVRQASRELSEKEREKLTVFLHRGAAGSWDFDVLANEFDLPDLLDWGFKAYELGVPGADDPRKLWEGMPEFEQEDLGGVQAIHVHFKTREDVKMFAELIGQNLTEKTRAIWFPQAERIDMRSEAYRDES